MRVENLAVYPVQLDDERVIGAAGTPEAVREYGLKALGKSDELRVSKGNLRVVEPEKPTAEGKTTKEKK